MTRCLAMILGYVLSACLALYAPGGMAGAASSDATLSMVICSDGVARTIEVSLDGIPVPDPDECCACLDCCAASCAALPVIDAASSPSPLVPVLLGPITGHDPARQQNSMRPMPRGPPVAAKGPMLAPGPGMRAPLSTAVVPNPGLRSPVGRKTGPGGLPSKDPAA